ATSASTLGASPNADFGGNTSRNIAPPIDGTDTVNKAYTDAGLSAANKRIDKADQGVAIAMAVQNPIFFGSDYFGVSFNLSTFDNNSAFGVAAAGLVGKNIFGAGEKTALTGGLGVGSGSGSNQVAGRVGVQFTW